MNAQVAIADILSLVSGVIGPLVGDQDDTLSRRSLTRKLNRIHRRILKHLRADCSADDAFALLEDFARPMTPQRLCQRVMDAINTKGLVQVEAASNAALLSVCTRTLEQLNEVAAELRAHRLDRSPDQLDVVLDVLAAQRTHRSLTTCFDIIPLDRIYVRPSLSMSGLPVDFSNQLRLDGHAICLTGPYGYGKSTLLRLIATRIEDPAQITPLAVTATPLPIYIRASSLADHLENKEDVWRAVGRIFNEMHTTPALEPDWASQLHHHAYIILLIDGLDEITDISSMRRLVRLALEAHVDMGDRGRVVFGTRDRAANDRVVQSDLDAYKAHRLSVAGFSDDQVAIWVKRWNSVVKGLEGVMPVKPQDLRDADGELQPVFRTPLVLLLRSLVSFTSQEQVNLASVFRSIIDATVMGKAVVRARSGLALYGLVDVASGARGTGTGLPKMKRRILQQAAYIALVHGDRFAPLVELRRDTARGSPLDIELTALEREERLDPEEAIDRQDLLKETIIAHFFDDRGGGFGFVHQSFVEYLCAELYLEGGERAEMLPTLRAFPDVQQWIWDLADDRSTIVPHLAQHTLESISSKKDSISIEMLVPRAMRHLPAEELPRTLRELTRVASKLTGTKRLRYLSELTKLSVPGTEVAEVSWSGPTLQGTFEEVTLAGCTITHLNQDSPENMVLREACHGIRFVRCAIHSLHLVRSECNIVFEDCNVDSLRITEGAVSLRFARTHCTDMILNRAEVHITGDANIKSIRCSDTRTSGNVSSLRAIRLSHTGQSSGPLVEETVRR